METTIAASNIDAQGPGITDRSKPCARINASEGATWSMTAHDYAPRRFRGGTRP
jgi:hypothetical protein